MLVLINQTSPMLEDTLKIPNSSIVEILPKKVPLGPPSDPSVSLPQNPPLNHIL